jgi:hypothetical protein
VDGYLLASRYTAVARNDDAKRSAKGLAAGILSLQIDRNVVDRQ